MSMQRRGFFAALLGGGAGVAAATDTRTEVAPRPKLFTVPDRWGGDKPEDITTVRSIIAAAASGVAFMSPRERSYWINFANGKQWDEEVEAERLREGRPCLVVNRIETLCSLAIDHSRFIGEWPLVHEFENLQIALAVRNADAQRAYNYVYSAYVESQQRPIRVFKADA